MLEGVDALQMFLDLLVAWLHWIYCGEFERNFREMYLSELELGKKKILGYAVGSFLELTTTIKDKNFYAKLFDKKDNFPFSIVRMSYLDSNVPLKMYYSLFGAEILKSVRTTNDATIFQRKSEILINQTFNNHT